MNSPTYKILRLLSLVGTSFCDYNRIFYKKTEFRTHFDYETEDEDTKGGGKTFRHIATHNRDTRALGILAML